MASFLPVFFLSVVAVANAAQLSTSYYKHSCPHMEEIVSDVVTNKQITNPTTAPGALRLFFHDCFVGGCDASVLVTSNHFNQAERDADINLSLPGDAFDAVVRAKTQLELACPGVVSCADILSLAVRDLVLMLGGPFYPVALGRRDALVSHLRDVAPNIPKSNMTVSQLVSLFASKGFSTRDLVALSGSHTVGFAHCKEYAERIYGHHGRHDPAMNPRYAQALQKACANYRKDPTIATFNDVMTPGKFDNVYYQNLIRGLGLLATDQALFSDSRTSGFVRLYAANQSVFFDDFARAMEKLSALGVKTGTEGEIRRRCDQFNTIYT